MKKTKPDGSKTIYMGGVYEVDKTSGGTVTRTVTYYPAGGAMRINIVGGSNTLYYILKDHLGSASVITDSSGNIVGEDRFYPYGETRLSTGSIYTDRLFTGQREMAGLGIYHYGARFYSPKLGRFLSADTIVPGAANPQAYNRYSYVLGNPLRYTDPTGHYCVGDDEDCADEGGNGPAPNPNPAPAPGGGGGNPHDDDDYDPNPSGYIPPPVCSSLICDPYFTGPYPPLTTPQQLDNFFEAFDIVGSVPEGGLLAALSVYAIIASCSLAGPACLITAPIFFTMAVVGVQHAYNGIQEYRQKVYDPSIEPTGREVIDLVFPFLKKEK